MERGRGLVVRVVNEGKLKGGWLKGRGKGG